MGDGKLNNFKYRGYSTANSKKVLKRGTTLENNFMGLSNPYTTFQNTTGALARVNSPGEAAEYDGLQVNPNQAGDITKGKISAIQAARNYKKPWLANTTSSKEISRAQTKTFGQRNQYNTHTDEHSQDPGYRTITGSNRNQGVPGYDKLIDPYQKNWENPNQPKGLNINVTGTNFHKEKENMVNIIKSINNGQHYQSNKNHNKSEEVRPGIGTKSMIDNYEIEKSLGKGSYAIVYLAKDIGTKEKVAIKVYEKSKLYNKTRRTIVEREIQVLSFVKHPNIIKLHRSIQTRNHVSPTLSFVYLKKLDTSGYGFRRGCFSERLVQAAEEQVSIGKRGSLLVQAAHRQC